MLRELHISGLGVIEDLDLSPSSGLTVLTGETGAGKTMVTVGLSLALGARASGTLVRQGSRSARVQARFDAGPEHQEWTDDDALVLARTVTGETKSSARISGQLATASALAEIGGALVEVHGQHQALSLLRPEVQTVFLDRFAGEAHVGAVARYRDLHERWRRASAELDALRGDERERERAVDLLAYQVGEIEAAAPSPGESEALAAEESRLANAERLRELAGASEEALTGESGAADAAATATRALEEARTLDPEAGSLSERARGLAAELAELSRDLRGWREGLEADPARLQEIGERVAALGTLRRKYGETDDEVLSFLDRARERLAQLGGADERAGLLEREVEGLGSELTDAAGRVTAGRRAAAPRLAAAIQDELRELGMPEAEVLVELVPRDPPGAAGAEAAELRVSTGAGQPIGPLASTASGGELSRAMLACRSVMADLDEVPTIVFDEVDAGIGGQAGLAVGRRLARLAATRQVIVVTHLPQIACFADLHVRVAKERGVASVDPLDDDARVRELARMLAGMAEAEGAESHARELLAEAGRASDDRRDAGSEQAPRTRRRRAAVGAGHS